MKRIISLLCFIIIILSMSLIAFAGSIPEDLLHSDDAQVFFAEVVAFQFGEENYGIEFIPIKKIKGDVRLEVKQTAFNFNAIGDFEVKAGKVYLFTYFDENNPTDLFEVTSYETSTLKLKNVEGDMWERFEKYLNEGRYLAAEHERIDKINNELVVENGETKTLSELLGGYNNTDGDITFHYPDGLDMKVSKVERKKFFKIADDIICTEIEPSEHNDGYNFYIVADTDKIGKAVAVSDDGKVSKNHPSLSLVVQAKYKINSADLAKLEQFMDGKQEKLPPLETPLAKKAFYSILFVVMFVVVFTFARGLAGKRQKS